MLRNIVNKLAFVAVVVGNAGALGVGCLDRPVTSQAPTIKTNFTSAVNQSGIDKVDILFDIDNSASMGDKQAYLIQAIPQMIARLVTPNCIGSNGAATGQTASPTTGECPTGSSPEFAAVHDMHIGVVTSSLGPRLGVQQNGTGGGAPSYVCDPTLTVTSMAGTTVSAFNDDKGHLINRTGPFGSGPALAPATLPEGGGFLYWFPALGNTGKTPVTPPAMPYTAAGAIGTDGTSSLVGDFSELVSGAGESGCGIESQLESWYRFLIQPDPYLQLAVGAAGTSEAGKGTWQGVDTTILQQRHDFLRPDSLVAIIVLSDENDSEIDVRSFQGSGYLFMGNVYNPSRATSACATNPLSASCASCAGCGQTGGPPASVCNDPNCKLNAGAFTENEDGSDWGYNLNLRHVHMQQKYGLDPTGFAPQFPLTRYYNGLTSTSVPNRNGEYPMPNSSYTGNNNCTNPLFASSLPTASDVTDATAITPMEVNTTLCNLPAGTLRTPADVFYAHIGGVPHQLLQVNAAACTAAGCTGAATDPASCATDCAQKDTLLSSDWVSILGQGPASYTGTSNTVSYDYTGIDPHMIEAMLPRNGAVTTSPCTGGACLGALEPIPASTPAATTLQGPGLVASAADPVRPDPVNGREWTTYAGVHSLPVDRQYACIFQLPVSSQRDCAALKGDSIEGNSCDCDPGNMTGNPAPAAWDVGGPAAPTGNTPDEIPPLCSKTSTDNPPSITSSVSDYTVQTYAKAYPTIRELMLANMMGAQGIVSSLCPIHTNDNAAGDDPLYGYRPAVNAIVNRLKSALGSQCVPELQYSDSKGDVPCLVLVTFGMGANGPTSSTQCTGFMGGAYSNVDPTVLAQFQQQQKNMAGDSGAGTDLANYVTCQLNQAPVPAGQTCVGGTTPGWCYVTGAGITGGSTCSQQISYSTTGVVPNNATISLQCISTNNNSDASAPAASAGDGG